MAYLYLNFADNMQSGSKSWDDFYTEPLPKQYEKIKKKLGGLAPATLQGFLQSALALQVQRTYYISVPGFDRRIKTNRWGKQCINNIVIRPAHDFYADFVLPRNFDLILIGDLTFDSVTAVTVKGIELIDTDVVKFGEKTVVCNALCAFTTKTVLNRNTGRSFQVPDYGDHVELHEAVLTNDFINMLCTGCYPVPHPEQAIWTLEEWRKYISFRKYYLKKQSERCEGINSVAACDSYILTKEVFRRNSDRLSAFLLDDIAEFGKGEQVILSREESGAESFPLIRVEIRKNRKTVLSDTVGKSGKGKPKFEVHLRRYTNEAMGLSSSQPNYDENGNVPKGYRFEQYLLGERYLFTHIDEEPDCSALERECEKAIEEKCAQIDNKYASIIAAELDRYMTSIAPELDANYQKLFVEYERDLAASLERDIAENNDREVRDRYEREILAPVRKAVDAERAELEKKLNNLEDEQSGEAAALREKIDSIAMRLEELLSAAQKQTPVSSYYIARNQKRLEEKKKSLAISKQAEIDNIRRDQQSNLQRQHKSAITAEKTEAEESFKKQLNIDKARKIEDETVRCYKIYFRPADSTDKLNEIQKQIESIAPKILYTTIEQKRQKLNGRNAP